MSFYLWSVITRNNNQQHRRSSSTGSSEKPSKEAKHSSSNGSSVIATIVTACATGDEYMDAGSDANINLIKAYLLKASGTETHKKRIVEDGFGKGYE